MLITNEIVSVQIQKVFGSKQGPIIGCLRGNLDLVDSRVKKPLQPLMP
jgi:hypothetical protein